MNQYLNNWALYFLIYFIKDIICSLPIYIKIKKNKILSQQKKHQTTIVNMQYIV